MDFSNLRLFIIWTVGDFAASYNGRVLEESLIYLDRSCYENNSIFNIHAVYRGAQIDIGIYFISLLIMNYWFTYYNKLIALGSALAVRICYHIGVDFYVNLSLYIDILFMLLYVLVESKLFSNMFIHNWKEFSLFVALLSYFCDILAFFCLFIYWFIFIDICIRFVKFLRHLRHFALSLYIKYALSFWILLN